MRYFTYCIKMNKQYVFSLIAFIVTLVTTITNFSKLTETYQKLLSGLVIILVIIAIVILILSIFTAKVYKVSDEKKIALYLNSLYDASGSVLISSTGGMKWVEYYQIKEKLIRKASHGNLTVIIPTKNEISNLLEENGARVYDYCTTGYKPCSNFSIINATSPDSFMAIGRRFGKYHIIEEYENSTTIMLIANDLIKVIDELESEE